MARVLALFCAAGIAAWDAPSLADSHAHTKQPPGNWHHPHWQGHDIHRFHERDYDHWRGGQWHRGWHDGHYGWWWQFGGLWYPYPAPIYPYPDPYRPPDIAPPPPTAYYPSLYYYCDNPAGYYPYVAECPSGWRAVPAPLPGQ